MKREEYIASRAAESMGCLPFGCFLVPLGGGVIWMTFSFMTGEFMISFFLTVFFFVGIGVLFEHLDDDN